MPLIIPSNSQSASGYTIGQSIRINDDDNAYLSRTLSTASDAGKTYTWSWWQKFGSKYGAQSMYTIHTDLTGGNFADYFYFYNDNFQYWSQPTGLYLRTDREFRDPSAWYHFVFIRDTTQAVSSERLRVYVNGIRETSFSTESYPALNSSGYFNTNTAHYIGGGPGTNKLDAYMAEIHFLDGLAYDPSFFGEFNDSGIWIPKQYTGSYGSNGFKIDGRDSSDLGDDESGNGNDFTSNNLTASDQVSDSPTNNFCTLNPNDNRGTPGTLSEGNLKMAFSATNDNVTGTQGISSGKWYWEAHIVDKSDTYIGVQDSAISATGYTASAVALWSGSYIYENNSDTGDRSVSYDNGDVVGIAFDADNKKIWWSKNGQWYSADDSSANTTINISEVEAGNQAQVITRSPDFFMPFFGNYTHSTAIFNFGQEGTFAGNETAGGNSDGNGVGNFFSTVPSGFLALCTNNLGS
jgi:hypothetical protein